MPELEGRAVGDQVGDVSRRSAARRRRSTGLAWTYGGTSTSTAEVDVVDMDEAVAERPRHRPIELGR